MEKESEGLPAFLKKVLVDRGGFTGLPCESKLLGLLEESFDAISSSWSDA